MMVNTETHAVRVGDSCMSSAHPPKNTFVLFQIRPIKHFEREDGKNARTLWEEGFQKYNILCITLLQRLTVTAVSQTGPEQKSRC